MCSPFSFLGIEEAKMDMTARVYGCGPSITTTRQDPADIHVGSNWSCLAIPWLTHWVCVDPATTQRDGVMGWFWKRTIPSYVHSAVSRDFPGSILFEHAQSHPIEQGRSMRVWWHYSSVHASIDLARILGCRTVYVHGIDYTGRDFDMRSIEDAWAVGVEGWKAFGVRVFNSTHGSALKALPSESSNT